MQRIWRLAFWSVALVSAAFCGVVLYGLFGPSDDFYPQFAMVQDGMTEEEVSKILQGIPYSKNVSKPGVDNWHFREKGGALRVQFYNIQFKEGRVISKDYDR